MAQQPTTTLPLVAIPSPFTPGNFVVTTRASVEAVAAGYVGALDPVPYMLILCEPEEEGGHPVEFVKLESARQMAGLCEYDGLDPYQLLYLATCMVRLGLGTGTVAQTRVHQD